MQKKRIFFAGVVLCLLVAAVGFYWYQKPRTNLSNVKPDYRISSGDLYSAFEQNEQKANAQYLGKIIQVQGIVNDVQVSDTTLTVLLASNSETGGINCSVLKDKETNAILPVKGKKAQLKGRCIGFLMDVNLAEAVIEP